MISIPKSTAVVAATQLINCSSGPAVPIVLSSKINKTNVYNPPKKVTLPKSAISAVVGIGGKNYSLFFLSTPFY